MMNAPHSTNSSTATITVMVMIRRTTFMLRGCARFSHTL